MKGSTLTRRPPVVLELPAGDPAASARRLTRSAWIIGAIALVLVVAFDLGPPLAFNDDWGFAWDVRHFNPLHIHMYPSDSALALVQVTFGWMVTLGHGDLRLLRLSEVAFVLLAMYAVHRLSRRLGADATWSAVSAITVLAFPVFAADATTFMTDVPYVGLLSAAVLGAVRWRDGARWIAVCVVFATLATLQRQVGAAMPIAVTLALLLFRRDGFTRRDAIGLTLLWAGCVAALVVPALGGITPPTQGNRLQAALAPTPVYVLSAFMFLPGLVGLGLLPVLPGLAMSAERREPRDRSGLFVFALVLVEIAVFLVAGGDIFPGNVFQPRGFTLTTLVPNLKPQLFPTPLFLGLEVGAVATVAFLLRRWRSLAPDTLGWPGVVLLLVGTLQFLPLMLLHYIAYDRYYLPIVVVLLPLAARAASGTRSVLLAGRLSLALVAALAVVYVVGEQDFQAWQVARDQTARLAYQQASPYDVNAGYEANAVYGEVPWYDSTGQVIGGTGIPGAGDFSVDGPKAPALVLQYANPDDPRPGYGWSSLAPGKIIIRVP
jgi:dolichyl-phosphate-mannose-protein mannosyltransferase